MNNLEPAADVARAEAWLKQLSTHSDREVASTGANLTAAFQRRGERLRSTAQALQTAYNLLDRDLQGFIDHVIGTLTTYQAVIVALDTYGELWYSRLPFSPAGRQQLAREMVARAGVVGVDVPLWKNWSKGSE